MFSVSCYLCLLVKVWFLEIPMRFFFTIRLSLQILLQKCLGKWYIVQQRKNRLTPLWRESRMENSLNEHLTCHSSRKGGSMHLKARRYENDRTTKLKTKNHVDTNVVSTALTVCKMKAAASSFESMIGLLAMCDANVCSIGHGR